MQTQTKEDKVKARSLLRAAAGAACAWPAIAGLALAGSIALASAAMAQEQDAKAILKSMSDFMAKQQNLSLTFDSDIEIITPEIEKVQFTNSGELVLSQPDKLRARRMSGYAEVELVYDGKSLSVFAKHLNSYASADVPGTIDQLIEKLRHEMGVELPAADLLLSNAYEALTANVTEAKYIGHGVVDGVDSHHLAFRTPETDWQIWIELGDRPMPRKYVITSKTMAAAPQYTLRIKSWNADEAGDASAFAFSPPGDAKKVELGELRGIDELPEANPEGVVQ
jgi:hypothetical protein